MKTFTVTLSLLAACTLLCCLAFCEPPLPSAAAPALTREGKDSASIVSRVTGFLQWYKIHLQQVNAFPLLAKDAQGYYTIDKGACRDYLRFLRSSHFIGDRYVQAWQKFFEDKSIQLKREKIKDDIPEDFDLDFILQTQEPDLVLDHLRKLTFRVLSMDGRSAVVGVRLASDPAVRYRFELYNGEEGWQIAYISNPDSD